ncbi:hypothetical protein ACWD4G_33560 [Streptomyces sp. NPDC002643]
MDQSRLSTLVASAADSGVYNAAIVNRLSMVETIEAGEVQKDGLLHTYRRRLRRSANNPELYRETESLVSFLEEFPDERLTMISVGLVGGGYELFLGDSAATKILYWMRMFSR